RGLSRRHAVVDPEQEQLDGLPGVHADLRSDARRASNFLSAVPSEADFGTFLPEFRGVSATVGAASSAAPATDGVGGARE
ncbi:hypothetical protein, partial [Enorma shizhengliae]|uniref:hypothetical protein n=1 Tax=Enorma shizhengliae TaxID=2606615 RepID=UPI001C5503B5